MNEPTRKKGENVLSSRIKDPPRPDLKAVYTILVNAYFRNHSADELLQREFEETSSE